MGLIDSTDAAGILGVQTAIRACKIMRDAGVPAVTAGGRTRNTFDARDVVKVAIDRRLDALARHRNDSAAYAREIRAQLRPPAPPVTKLDGGRSWTNPDDAAASLKQDRGEKAMVYLSPDAAMIFGPGVIKAAAADLKPGVCRFCVAHVETAWGGIGPDLSPAVRELLGDPCLRCAVDLTPAKPVTARPHTARTRPVAAPAAGSITAAAQWLEKAADADRRGDTAAARAARHNAQTWMTYGRGQR